MQDRSMPSPDQRPPLLAFTPVPRKCRRVDGWTPERQRAFIAALADTGSVTAAARAVNMSHATAYDLYNHPEGASFRAAWNHALSLGVQRLKDGAMERAINGVPSPIFYKGEQVGERRIFSEHLVSLILRHHDPAFGGQPVPGRAPPALIEHETATDSAAPGQDRQELGDRLLRLYAEKCGSERENRLAVRVVAADFYMRQLVCLELLFAGMGVAPDALVMWKSLLVYDEAVCAPLSELHDNLVALREAAWAKAGDPPRPAARPGPPACGAMGGGPTIMARYAIQKGAQHRIAAAQAMWEAAASEGGWAAYLATNPDAEHDVP